MIVCKVCGNHNDDADTFCGSCQTFLEWDGVRVDDAPRIVVAPPPESQVKPGLIERVKTAVGLDGHPQPSAVDDLAARDEAARDIAARDQAARDEAARRAEAMSKPVVEAVLPTNVMRPSPMQPPVAVVARGPGQPEAQPPGEIRRPVPPTFEPRVERNPGDLICGQCGVGNGPTRKFCRSCGAPLAEAVVVHIPWWRRLFRRHPKTGTEPSPGTGAGRAPASGAAGPVGLSGAPGASGPPDGHGATDRVRKSGRAVRKRARMTVRAGKSVVSRFMRVAAVLGVIGVAGVSLGPWRNGLHEKANRFLQNVRQKIHSQVSPTYQTVHPINAIATSSAGGHAPSLLIDNADNTYWSEGKKPNGTLSRVTVTFESPVEIGRVGFRNGSADDATIEQPRRPEKVRLLFGGGQEKEVTLKDVVTFQAFSVSAHKVKSVDIVIESVHGPAKGHPSSITEIEFFTKK